MIRGSRTLPTAFGRLAQAVVRCACSPMISRGRGRQSKWISNLAIHFCPTSLALLLGVALGFGVSIASAERVTLWHAQTEREARALEAFIARYQREHVDIQVEVLQVPYGGFDARLTNAHSVGQGPHLFLDAHDRMRRYHNAQMVCPLPERETPAAVQIGGAPYAYPLTQKGLVLYARRGQALRLPIAWDSTHAYSVAAWYSAWNVPFLVRDHAAVALGWAGVRGVAATRELQQLWQSNALTHDFDANTAKNAFRERRIDAVVLGTWVAPDLLAEDVEVRPLSALQTNLMRTGEGNAAPGMLRPFITYESVFLAHPYCEHSEAQALANALAEADVWSSVLAVPASAAVLATVPQSSRTRELAAALANGIPMDSASEVSLAFDPLDRALLKIARGAATPESALREAERRFQDLLTPLPEAASWPPYAAAAFILATGLGFYLRRKRKRTSISGTATALGPPRHRWAFASPAVVLVAATVGLPLSYAFALSATSGTTDTYFVGLANFHNILTNRGHELWASGSFYRVLAITVLWTLLNVAAHVALGVLFAKLTRGLAPRTQTLAHATLLLPWAIPSYVSALAFRAMFHTQEGLINQMLALFGASPVAWFAHFNTAFFANVATNVWLGFPFMYVAASAAFAAVGKETLEAAELDGASAWRIFWSVEWPTVQRLLRPAIALGTLWTFNMFNVVFLVSGGEPDGETELLISEAYRWAFSRGAPRGYAAAYAVLIFALLLLLSRLTEANDGKQPKGAA